MRKNDETLKKTALWAITPEGVNLALSLASSIPEAEVFLSENLDTSFYPSYRFKSLKQTVAEKFNCFRAHVFFMSTGIVVRVIAPHLKSKISDPAVVAVDDSGTFAVSLVSGHLGGANRLTGRIADILGAVPVITTATDVNGKPSIDMMAVDKNLTIENPEVIKKINMAFLTGKPVGISDPYGFFKEYADIFDSSVSVPRVFIDDSTEKREDSDLVLRPKILVAGIGCNRNTEKKEISDLLFETMEQSGLSVECLASVASIDAKKDEKGILELAEELGLPLRFFSREQLSCVSTIETPSLMVEKHMGVKSVCEAAAILGAETGNLLVPKRKTANVTVALARMNFT